LPQTGGSASIALTAALLIAIGLGATLAGRRSPHVGVLALLLGAGVMLIVPSASATASSGCVPPSTRPPTVTTTVVSNAADTTTSTTTTITTGTTTITTAITTAITATTSTPAPPLLTQPTEPPQPTVAPTEPPEPTEPPPLVPPDAVDDNFRIDYPVRQGPAIAFQFQLLPNDARGVPVAIVTSVGDDDLGGDVTSFAVPPGGSRTIDVPGGTVTVSSDGTVVVDTQPSDAPIWFRYRLENDVDHDDALVKIIRTRPIPPPV
jgi:hypothetical protein